MMKILKEIRVRGIGKVSSAITYFSNKDFEFDILDTDTDNIEKGLSIDKIDNVFGVVDNADNKVCFEVSEKLWYFLGISNGVEKVPYSLIPQDVKCLGVNINEPIPVTGIRGDTIIQVLTVHCVPIDDLGIFWEIGMTHVTILDIYIHVFRSIPNIKDNTEIYLFCKDSNYYRLDVNKSIIIFITKMITLMG